MALRIIREVSRSLAFSKKSGTTIIAGMPLMLDDAATLKPFSSSASTVSPYGIALEDTAMLPLQGANGETAGQGYDYTNFARGGNYSVLLDGGEVELFDDGRGAPFVTTDLYLLNEYVYANSSGLVSSVANGEPLGVVTSVTGSPVTLLRIKLLV